MVLKSRFTAPVPECSVQKWIFGSSKGSLPDKKAWIDADRPNEHYLTLKETRLLAKRMAVGLLDTGLQSGDRVLLFSANNLYYPVAVLAVWMAGGIFTGANPIAVARELAYQLKDSDARFMLAADNNIGIALEAAKAVGMTRDRIFAFDSSLSSPAAGTENAIPHWSHLLGSREMGEQFEWIEPVDCKSATCAINYSSGTTGLPKGVEITHHNMVANGVGFLTLKNLDPKRKASKIPQAGLSFLPMYHAYGQVMFITILAHEQVPIYIMPTFDLAKMLAHIQAFRITMLFAVPPVLVLLSKYPQARHADFSSLESIASGAAPLASNTQKEIDQLLPADGPKISQGWGMTEITCLALAWDARRETTSGVGELLPDCRAKIIDTEDGMEIFQAHKQGELWISSPAIMRGYWRNPKATAETVFIDEEGIRWLRTGDIAFVERYDEGAIFHIVDRFKELIKVNGFQVAPAELEALLLERDDIADVGVIGVSTTEGELPRAYVVKTPGARASEEEIAAWLAQRVSRYKQLTGGVVFVNVIPKNPSGKIIRKILRDRANNDRPRLRPRL